VRRRRIIQTMSSPSSPTTPRLQFEAALETTLRLGLVLALLLWCIAIVRPFITTILWGIILAIALAPAHRWMAAALGGRRKLAAVIFVVLGLTLLIGPALQLSSILIDSTQEYAAKIESGTLKIPPPPAGVAQWPVVGERVSSLWSLAASNLEAALELVAPQIKALGAWLLGAAAELGGGILKFILSMIIAGVALASSAESSVRIGRVATRLAGANGEPIVKLAESTIRSVATGIVGVALIQTTLAGIGLVIVGVPAAGFLALLVLFLCIVQLGPALIMLPAAIYVFSSADTLTASLFLAWSVFVLLLDNVLKPLLLGRGVDAPILVIFLGAIGGFLSMGIIGLFVGAVVLVLFYTLAKSWVNDGLLAEEPKPAPVAQSPASGG
jgi:predicted PurR-regulated permease PerM